MKRSPDCLSKEFLLFDFDGTLANTLPLTVRCVNTLAKEYDYPLVKETAVLRNKTMQAIIKENLKLSAWQLPRYLRKLKKLLADNAHEITLVKDMPQIIRLLSKNHSLGIITSNSNTIVDAVLDKGRISDAFEFIHTDSSLFGKSVVIKKVLKKYKIHKENVAYIGDETRDIEACKRLELTCISVCWGFNSKEALLINNPDYLVETPKGLLKIFC